MTKKICFRLIRLIGKTYHSFLKLSKILKDSLFGYPDSTLRLCCCSGFSTDIGREHLYDCSMSLMVVYCRTRKRILLRDKFWQ